MSRYCFLIGLFLCLCLGSVGAEKIRGTHWGMTMEQVKAVEKWEYVQKKKIGNKDYLAFRGELKPGVDTDVHYEFYDGLLVKITYLLDKKKETYQYFFPILLKKYGYPYDRRAEGEVRKKEAEMNLKVLRMRELGLSLPFPPKIPLFLYERWKIHGAKSEEKTHLQLYYSEGFRNTITYENLEYQRQKKQLEKDKKRDGVYSLENSDDL